MGDVGQLRGSKQTRDRQQIASKYQIEKFTCDDCAMKDNCPYAFDPYNTDGDCLAEK